MHEIEVACARIASQRLNLLARSEIEAAQAECVKAAEAGDRKEYLRANEAFHETIYRATGNPYMAEMASEFRRRTGPFRAKKFMSAEDLIESARSHQALIDDIFSEDSGTASGRHARPYDRELYAGPKIHLNRKKIQNFPCKRMQNNIFVYKTDSLTKGACYGRTRNKDLSDQYRLA